MTEDALRAIRYENGKLDILDQTLLPHITKYVKIKGVEDGWKVINKMQVRGAPAIAIVGCLSLVVEIWNEKFENKKVMRQEVEGKLNYLVSSRPTAVNMKIATDDLIQFANKLCETEGITIEEMKSQFIQAIEKMLAKDVEDNKTLSEVGANEILSKVPGDGLVRIMTHCNTGSLATAGYGTALGVIRALNNKKRLEQVYFTETRPYNQGARLTAYELVHDKIPATLITDSMAGWTMLQKKITAVVVGADRVAANGDTANKIGTYQIALLAKSHNIPFYIAAPFTSIDLNLVSGDYIVIEERPDKELTHVGDLRIAADGIRCWNPAFDVTPADLITGFITERGLLKASDIRELKKQKDKEKQAQILF